MDELVAYAHKSIRLSTIINILFKRHFMPPQFTFPISFSVFFGWLLSLLLIFSFISVAAAVRMPVELGVCVSLPFSVFTEMLNISMPFLLIYAHFWFQLIGL